MIILSNNLTEEEFFDLIISSFKSNNFNDNDIVKYLSLIACGLEIFKNYFEDYKNKLLIIYDLYYTIVNDFILKK